MPTYNYNPHQHVKIWLSKNPSSFLNMENQLRLVRLRQINPDDVINFVYDSKLLSRQAQSDLAIFCDKHGIVSKNIQIIQKGCHTWEERNLLTIYHKEVSCLNNGGNPAVASDILRWLSPVYKLGTYTDFDVDINTHGLPATISVEQPMLLNIGSVTLVKGMDSPCINNDTLAIVDETDSLHAIKTIQQALHRGCSSQISSTLSVFLSETKQKTTDAAVKYYKNLYHNLGFSEETAQQAAHMASQSLVSLFLSLDPMRETISNLALYGLTKNPLDTRKQILKDCEDNQSFLSSTAFNPSFQSLATFAEIARAQLREKLTLTNWLIMPAFQYNAIKNMANIINDEQFIEQLRNDIKNAFLRVSVIHTSGPAKLMAAFIDSTIYDTKVFDDTYLKYTFETYGLSSNFKSKNHIKIHSSAAETNKLFTSSMVTGTTNDLSWLDVGENIIRSREDKMSPAATKIQHLFQNRKATLPAIIQKTRLEVENHIQKIDNNHTSILFFYRPILKGAKIQALRGALSHFNENEFNITTFQNNVSSYQSNDIAATFTTSKSKGLIDKLTIFSRQAQNFNISHQTEDSNEQIVSLDLIKAAVNF